MITYEDKVALYENTDIANINKVTADDMNEIKNVVNGMIESGSNDNGSWIKYSDGRLITMHKVTRNLARTATWGNMYESTTQADLGNYPMAFKDIPFVYVTLHEVNALLEAVQFSSANNAGKVYILAPTSSKSADYVFHVLAIGKWK